MILKSFMYKFILALDRLHLLLKLSFFQHMHHLHSADNQFGLFETFKPIGEDGIKGKAHAPFIPSLNSPTRILVY